MEARISVPKDGLGVVLIHDSRKIQTIRDAERYLHDKVEDFIETCSFQTPTVILGDEYCDPFFPVHTDAQYILRRSRLSKLLRRARASTYFMCGKYLLKSEGDNTILSKNNGEIHGAGNVGFRLCGTATEYPLSPLDYYFVPAAGLGGELARSDDTVVYVNDGVRGMRRVGEQDTGWVIHDQELLREWDSDSVRHFLLEI